MAVAKEKLCRFCKSKIHPQAKVCPQCGKKQGMGCVGCAICGIAVLFIFYLIGVMTGDGGQITESSSNYENSTPVKSISVSSRKLIQEFKDNQLRCKNKYNGKMLKVTGPVVDMRETFGQAYVCLGDDSDFAITNIQCMVSSNSEKSKIMNLDKGQIITVKGKANVMALGFTLEDSVIIK